MGRLCSRQRAPRGLAGGLPKGLPPPSWRRWPLAASPVMLMAVGLFALFGEQHGPQDPARWPRRLQDIPSSGTEVQPADACSAARKGLPAKGVLYIPHLVGEPYPRPESDPEGYYDESFRRMHQRDMPLIGRYLGADTLLLRPWIVDTWYRERSRQSFFEEMGKAGVCNIIPTFHLAKYYSDMLKEGRTQPNTDGSSPLSRDFVRFGGSVDPEALGNINVAAWTVDVSLDLSVLLPQVEKDCKLEPADESYSKYKLLLEVLVQWVRQKGSAGSVAPSLQAVPLLVPLDLSRVTWSLVHWEDKLHTFLNCMAEWSPVVFGQTGSNSSTRWLLSYAIPYSSPFSFEEQLASVAEPLEKAGMRAVVLVGAQALSPDPTNQPNPVEDTGDTIDEVRQQRILQGAFDSFAKVNATSGNLDGFIIDEWQDDWDRGSRGPFFLAKETLREMTEECESGGRFSHDVGRCTRSVGNGVVYPEYLGLASSSSRALRHCVSPRFRNGAFSFGNTSMPEARIPIQCSFAEPTYTWIMWSAVLLGLVMLLQGGSMAVKWWSREHEHIEDKEDVPRRAEKPSAVGYVTIEPKEARLRGNHVIQLRSNRMRSNEEAGWWLWTHQSCQMSILERQLDSELAARRALRSRAAFRSRAKSSDDDSQSGSDSDSTDGGFGVNQSDDLKIAMSTIHRRSLEGFAAWLDYVSSGSVPEDVSEQDLERILKGVRENEERPLSKLFAEALLLRVMESLSEQILHCPERLSFLLYGILAEVPGGTTGDAVAATFTIDFERLQNGLTQMNHHSNPFIRGKMPDGKWVRGLNFDDINDCGIQCREDLVKTWKEPTSVMVLVDFMLCYRGPFMLKVWTFLVSAYIYLGTGFGNDITTSYNGSWFKPKWLRVNYIQYVALIDSSTWVGLEMLLVLYVGWQRWPSLYRKSPGVPTIWWLLEHLGNLAFSAAGGIIVYTHGSFIRKPWLCRQSQAGPCDDPRAKSYADLWNTLRFALIYWAGRFVIFTLMHRKRFPIFLRGSPWDKSKDRGIRGQFTSAKGDALVNLVWVFMLVFCIYLEVTLLLPSMKGLEWNTACGFDILGPLIGLPEQRGTCSDRDQWLSFGCVTCVSAISLAGMLVFLGSMVDIYFVFYIFSAVVGSIMGHDRHLNDLKNTSLPVDLRPQVGREAKLFEHTFGPGWQHIWRQMVLSLLEESWISPKNAAGLVEAAGIALDGQELITRRDKKEKPIHLTRFPQLAAERLAFFFQSLQWIQAPSGPARGVHFEPETDALTGRLFDPGTVPSLTQIIPAYNEVVIPSVDYLRAGALPEDAMNQSPDDQPGVGDLTGPPLGDGMNTNLAFLISQFPDEWTFFAKRLHNEGLMDEAAPHELYKRFLRQRLREELVVEVRLWAAMRTQSVGKTVIGALQYERALASLPRIRDYYASKPGKRLPEDHAEVILAHQTYGQRAPEGNPENDAAVRLLLSRYGKESLVLVFDLTPESGLDVWQMAEAFLRKRGGYELGAFDYASVKCRWDDRARSLQVLEVLPRKFPLRIGKGEYKTQGKAANQLNGLRFASGHYVQALDCNMGVFAGEGFKVPYVLRAFMPLDQRDRVEVRCRFLGFREHIFTGREGTVGKCHATSEWTFGTIYQRFLSGLGARMHYGHPDFVDCFWARNRGGMSKSSAAVNLSEDLFAGYNVRMREEASPHVDVLEFEKGREASFNAASNFFAKISGGSIAVLRSRDNHLLCERIGILHSLSFYFTSVAFYVSNLLVDISINLYVTLFIVFTLANIDLGKLTTLGSSFSTEWLFSMGIMTMFPQLFEMILEYGAIHALKDVLGNCIASMLFFIFQNKNIAAAMRTGATTGVARYLSTGRPMANQHQTWKDIYISYWNSHYEPACSLMMAYIIYNVLVSQTFQGKLPMVLVVISFLAWIVTPIIFSPFPRWSLMEQDLRDFSNFINGRAGMELEDLPEVVVRGRSGRVRTLWECGLSFEISLWSERPIFVLLGNTLVRLLLACYVSLALPAETLDFVWIYVIVLSVQWFLVFAFFIADLNNILLTFSILVWLLVLPMGPLVIGPRANSPTLFSRIPEYIISFTVFVYGLTLAKYVVLLHCRLLHAARVHWFRVPEKEALRRLQESVRLAYLFFFTHQMHIVKAYVVLVADVVVCLFLICVDRVFCNAHTWWLLNNELARTKAREQYLEKQPTFFEQEGMRSNYASSAGSTSAADSDSEEASSISSHSMSKVRLTTGH